MKSIKNIFLVLFFLNSLNVLSQSLDSLLAPNFSLRDTSGNIVSLSDFKGKVVYIDFWASWCGPCLKEIPHSKKLIQEFKDNSTIVFLGVSIDGNEEKWKNTVQAKNIPGIQLISKDGKESSILKNYNVKSIPRFVIIDKSGKMIEEFAPRPSERGISKLLTKLIS